MHCAHSYGIMNKLSVEYYRQWPKGLADENKMCIRDRCYSQGAGTERNDSEAVNRLEWAAEHGSSGATVVAGKSSDPGYAREAMPVPDNPAGAVPVHAVPDQ